MSILRKRISAILLSLAMVTAVALPTFADDTQSYTPMQISADLKLSRRLTLKLKTAPHLWLETERLI